MLQHPAGASPISTTPTHTGLVKHRNAAKSPLCSGRHLGGGFQVVEGGLGGGRLGLEGGAILLQGVQALLPVLLLHRCLHVWDHRGQRGARRRGRATLAGAKFDIPDMTSSPYPPYLELHLKFETSMTGFLISLSGSQ